ncbi:MULTISPECIES: hypothetical protein [unclassified Rhodococcus (in: high G+C Gram-positive bacteria)]|uniref:hypothetical protein n=1 Tax=unclassified Rhodococcus (in: high G+C Gram-positive bacteria) TaxID=192944 RepID=UPI0029549F4D|nr:hypothetical protein [Rhodococcus sp. IEGM 1343]MDV8055071.1 hypothetical protein [Rhodococcus sp. IEGM 1343]
MTDLTELTTAELAAKVTVLESRLELLLSCYQELAEDLDSNVEDVDTLTDRLAAAAYVLIGGDESE